VKLSTASIERLGEQQKTGALSKQQEVEIWVTRKCEQRIRGRGAI
jgi:hypothetical protein